MEFSEVYCILSKSHIHTLQTLQKNGKFFNIEILPKNWKSTKNLLGCNKYLRSGY